MKIILRRLCNIDHYANKCEIKIFLKGMLPTSKFARKYKIISILFIFYFNTHATTAKVIHSLTKQHIKCILQPFRRRCKIKNATNI